MAARFRLLLFSALLGIIAVAATIPLQSAEADPRRIAWDAQDTLDRYLYLWRNERFDEMYELTASSLREKTSRQTFVETLKKASREGVRLREYAVGDPVRGKKKRTASQLSIPVRMVFVRTVAGPSADETIKVNKSIAAVQEGSEWRISGSVTGTGKGKGRKYIEGLIP
ncbi:MAG: hypothetical protein OEV28_06230 [Nitrospirota bacterium]|nr:hypothetical protein [Nitrospirota bacterium]